MIWDVAQAVIACLPGMATYLRQGSGMLTRWVFKCCKHDVDVKHYKSLLNYMNMLGMFFHQFSMFPISANFQIKRQLWGRQSVLKRIEVFVLRMWNLLTR